MITDIRCLKEMREKNPRKEITSSAGKDRREESRGFFLRDLEIDVNENARNRIEEIKGSRRKQRTESKKQFWG